MAEFCSECGQPLLAGAKFCAECGTSAGGQSQPAAKTEQVARVPPPAFGLDMKKRIRWDEAPLSAEAEAILARQFPDLTRRKKARKEVWEKTKREHPEKVPADFYVHVSTEKISITEKISSEKPCGTPGCSGERINGTSFCIEHASKDSPMTNALDTISKTIQGNAANIVCPHCGSKGTVWTRKATQKGGLRPSKFAAGWATMGLSFIYTGVRKHNTVVKLNCTNCGMKWTSA